jgi:choline-sulfatase
MGCEHGAWQKMVFFEASVRVPMIVRWPGRIAAGRRVADLAGLIDLYPTLCDAAAVQTPRSCEGVSLLPLLQGGKPLGRDAVFSETVLIRRPEMAGCMIRCGRWKYCLYLDRSAELYDLEADPHEMRNLAGTGVAIGEELKERVVAFWEPEQQSRRYQRATRVPREKHFYPFANQFLLGDGTVVDARP